MWRGGSGCCGFEGRGAPRRIELGERPTVALWAGAVRYRSGRAAATTRSTLSGTGRRSLALSGGTLALHLISAPMAFYFGYVYPFNYDEQAVMGVA